jgi:hypothetical protein
MPERCLEEEESVCEEDTYLIRILELLRRDIYHPQFI